MESPRFARILTPGLLLALSLPALAGVARATHECPWTAPAPLLTLEDDSVQVYTGLTNTAAHTHGSTGVCVLTSPDSLVGGNGAMVTVCQIGSCDVAFVYVTAYALSYSDAPSYGRVTATWDGATLTACAFGTSLPAECSSVTP